MADWDTNIEAAAEALDVRNRQYETLEAAAEGAVVAFLEGWPVVQWCEEHRAMNIGLDVPEDVCTFVQWWEQQRIRFPYYAAAQIVPQPCRFVERVMVEPKGERRLATHTNYNTGEPCFCDAPFDFQPGPCVDAPEPITGTSPENGSG